jgi:hypothetical protein
MIPAILAPKGLKGEIKGPPLRPTSHMEVGGVKLDRKAGFPNRSETWAVLVIYIAVC